jgi:hypothetical protein
MQDDKLILEGIGQITEAQKLQTQGILKCIEANAVVTGDELRRIRKHLSDINGTVARLQKESDERKQVVLDFRAHQKFGLWVHKNWWVVSLLFIGVVTLVVALIDTIGVRGLWTEFKDIR